MEIEKIKYYQNIYQRINSCKTGSTKCAAHTSSYAANSLCLHSKNSAQEIADIVTTNIDNTSDLNPSQQTNYETLISNMKNQVKGLSQNTWNSYVRVLDDCHKFSSEMSQSSIQKYLKF